MASPSMKCLVKFWPLAEEGWGVKRNVSINHQEECCIFMELEEGKNEEKEESRARRKEKIGTLSMPKLKQIWHRPL